MAFNMSLEMNTSTNSTYNSKKCNENSKNNIVRSIVKEYKTKYPITFAELKLDGFSDADAVKYIRNNIEFDNTSSSVTFMKQLIFN